MRVYVHDSAMSFLQYHCSTSWQCSWGFPALSWYWLLVRYYALTKIWTALSSLVAIRRSWKLSTWDGSHTIKPAVYFSPLLELVHVILRCCEIGVIMSRTHAEVAYRLSVIMFGRLTWYDLKEESDAIERYKVLSFATVVMREQLSEHVCSKRASLTVLIWLLVTIDLTGNVLRTVKL